MDHRNLLLERVTQGISDQKLKWFASYLQDRTAQVCVAGKYSEPVTLDVSLPQGSQLEPPLYSDYTQSIGQLIRLLHLLFHGYADDTWLVHIIGHRIANRLASSIDSIREWMHDNRFKLNPEKTEFMVIASSRNIEKLHVDLCS